MKKLVLLVVALFTAIMLSSCTPKYLSCTGGKTWSSVAHDQARQHGGHRK